MGILSIIPRGDHDLVVKGLDAGLRWAGGGDNQSIGTPELDTEMELFVRVFLLSFPTF